MVREKSHWPRLEMPAAGQDQVVEVDGAGPVIRGIWAKGIQETDIGFETPLKMLAAEEGEAGLEPEIKAFELFLAVKRVPGIGIDVIRVRRNHVGEGRAEAQDRAGTVPVFEMIAKRQEKVGLRHRVDISPNPSPMPDIAGLGAHANARHQRPTISERAIQSIGNTQCDTRIQVTLIATFQEKAAADREVAFRPFPPWLLLRECRRDDQQRQEQDNRDHSEVIEGHATSL